MSLPILVFNDVIFPLNTTNIVKQYDEADENFPYMVSFISGPQWTAFKYATESERDSRFDFMKDSIKHSVANGHRVISFENKQPKPCIDPFDR